MAKGFMIAVGIVSILAVLGGVVLTNAETANSLSDINAKVAQLDIDTAVLDDVIYTFGEPLKYVCGNETIPREKIPADWYIMVYPDNFSVVMRQDAVTELRFESPAAGYVFHDKIQVGSSLDEVLAVLGEATETVVGKSDGWIDGVLYTDIDGQEGRCYYQRSDWNVRMFFKNYKVSALYITSNPRPDNKEIVRKKEEDTPSTIYIKDEDLPSTSSINEEGRIVDKIDYPFVNDPEAIGCWEVAGFVKSIEDFDPETTKKPQNSPFKEMFIFENGRTNLPTTWTKGLLLNPVKKTAEKYMIEEIDSITYMFFEWKSGDYTIDHLKPEWYVLKKVPDKVHIESRTYDKIDYPFINDPQVIGIWETVDFVESPEEFDPEERKWPGGELYLGQLVIEPNGQMSETLGKKAQAEAELAKSKAVEAAQAEYKKFFEELGVNPDGRMSEILNKTVYEFDQAMVKITGESSLAELAEFNIDPNMKMSELLSKDGPYFKLAPEEEGSDSFFNLFTDPNAKISDIFNWQPPETKSALTTWTKGLIITSYLGTTSRYEIKEIDGATYMFYEWKKGDYINRQMKPKYYVLKKK